jgi:hypothetical protein
MDYDGEIRRLAGEHVAVQAILVAISAKLAMSGMDRHMRDAFDAAASFVETQTIAFGTKVPPEHLAHALRVVEELRSAALGDQDKPKHRV